jgi:hypothetical protein
LASPEPTTTPRPVNTAKARRNSSEVGSDPSSALPFQERE